MVKDIYMWNRQLLLEEPNKCGVTAAIKRVVTLYYHSHGSSLPTIFLELWSGK